MAVEADVIYRNREQITADWIQRFQSRIPDLHVEEDGNIRITGEVLGEILEGVYLANQLLRDNIWVQTANITELRKHGAEVAFPIKTGTTSTGTLKLSGVGGKLVVAGAEVASDPGTGDLLYFVTTADATIPNPGIATAPVITDAGAGGLTGGTYELAVTFVTAGGETQLGAVSAPLTLPGSHNITIASVPVGGPGTIARNLYTRVNGGAWQKITQAAVVTAFNDNTTTTFTPWSAFTVGGAPPDISTAESISVAGASEEAGSVYNVSLGTITQLANVPDGVSTVTNTTAFAGGSDEQDAESYRNDLLEYLRNPKTGSPSDLKSWAEEISGVASATVFQNDNVGVATNGHVTVRIVGPDGTVPSASVIQAVLDNLILKDIANITIHVATFSTVATNVTVATTLLSGYVLADVSANVQQAIKDYINGVAVGGTVYIAGIFDAVFGLPGIATLTVSVPATDQTSTATQKRIPGTITVT